MCWPFHFKDGPLGQRPLGVADGGGQRGTMVRALPGQNGVIAGFRDGAEARVIRGSTGLDLTGLAVTPSLAPILVGEAAAQPSVRRLGSMPTPHRSPDAHG
ncbi:hypothetical protein EKE94_17915 [Mesobaculum littorinae]|uniref:Uncharacterized protein n=1 Tax=Mesobaculum littorinae TaxID=2486419 RepID=A0A438AD34_9RHOB|nr:hypothetical protein [Mesobaculum littorinae]RVV96600.1 hypothetical protein EKE94_17915 [Mesobaculum littorinae]